MMNFERFDDIKHMPLRVYNRTVLMCNIMSDFGKEASERYVEQFEEHEKQQMYLMLAFVKFKGVDAARKFVTNNLEVVNG